MVSFASKHNDPKANLSWSERIGYGMGNYGLASECPLPGSITRAGTSIILSTGSTILLMGSM